MYRKETVSGAEPAAARSSDPASPPPAQGVALRVAPGAARVSATVRKALRLIEEGLLDRASVPELAAAVGIGERHLRRLFARDLGSSPLDVAQGRRLRRAVYLIENTRLSIAIIALEAGFRSVRRFNSAFRDRYGCAPMDLRRRHADRPPEVQAAAPPAIRRTPSPSQT